MAAASEQGGDLVGRRSGLYAHPLPAGRASALYRAFSYPTKISPEVVALFVATHTRPGDTVLDPFGGSGTTGIAAMLCDQPTPALQELARRAGVSPKWGPRTAVIYELGVMGSFLTSVMCHPPDPTRFRAAATSLLDQAEAEHGWLYEATGPAGESGIIRHVIWSEVLVCPGCGHQVTYWDAAVRRDPLRMLDIATCDSCGARGSVREWKRATTTVRDPGLNISREDRVRVPVRVYGRSGRATWQRSAIRSDSAIVERAAGLTVPEGMPLREIEWADLYRSGYHQGISHLHHFYTPRNLLATASVWRRVDEYPEDLQAALRLLVLSFNAAHATLMSRVVVKDGSGDFVLTGAQSGVLYISSLPVEKNVFSGIRRKVATLSEAFRLTRGSRSQVRVVNASSTHLDIPSGSVAYVFTDPPFGGYIPYAEINQINEAWLGVVTDRTEEAIVSPGQGKSASDYGQLVTRVMAEVGRVLKPNGLATLVFHSSQAEVWQEFARAINASGLQVAETSILDKIQPTFKQTVSAGGTKGDTLLLLVPRPSNHVHVPASHEILTDVMAEAAARGGAELSPEWLYSRYVGRCVATGARVQFDAPTFYEMVSNTALYA